MSDDPRAPASRRFVSIIFVMLMLLVISGWWVNEHHSCERNSSVRVEDNRQQRTLQGFLMAAAESREATAVIERERGDTGAAEQNEATARRYRVLAADLEPELPMLECDKAFPDR